MLDGRVVPDLGYADDFLLLASTAAGLKRLVDAVTKFCTSMAMVISIQNTKAIAFRSTICTLCLFNGLLLGDSLKLCFNSDILVSFSQRIRACLLLLGPSRETYVCSLGFAQTPVWALAMLVLCGPPLQALNGVCSKHSVIWLRDLGLVKVASLCCHCSAATVTIPRTHVEGNFRGEEVHPNPNPLGRMA